MKLFVWSNPYDVRWGSSLFFAVAETVDEARAIALTAPAFSFGEYSQATPCVSLGEPLRVIDLPCGEWHEWSE